MREATLWAVILAAGIGTFLIRVSFLLVFEQVDGIPPRVQRVLRYVPAAVLAALVLPEFALSDAGGTTAHLLASVAPAQLLAGAVAAGVAWRTESVLWTIVVGMAALVALQSLPLPV
ncbi:AzlD domain-containing protein [Halomarina litorea]|uniref:AzlD domain-containing protein n=1 Tax=Halomarina litorea TaxID=2961595 RepID=UPI0020C26882|nr:AzlD domain-containing protein [Halomarina sp. BCD28]